jgi:hypothetical protein
MAIRPTIFDNIQIPVNKPTLRQRLLMTWELTWPLALMDLSVVVILHGMLDVQGETGDSIWAVAAFFAVSPWVVRRAFARAYDKRRVIVMHGAEKQARLTYQESLKVMWLIAWRSTVLSLAALLVISGVLRFAAPNAIREFDTPDPYRNALGLSAVDTLTSLAFTPLLIPGMLRKRFKGFHLAWE